jgi:hypothetical protein
LVKDCAVAEAPRRDAASIAPNLANSIADSALRAEKGARRTTAFVAEFSQSLRPMSKAARPPAEPAGVVGSFFVFSALANLAAPRSRMTECAR